LKGPLALMLAPLAWASRVIAERWTRLWSFARLKEALGGCLDASNVVLGAVELQGTRNIALGRGALVYPGVYLETQGAGRIEIGDRVVLSRGVHIVAHEHVVLGDDCMVGEYTSLRDANHRPSIQPMRDSGHDSAPIVIGRNVWIGRGATVLKGTRIGAHSIVGANAVVTRDLGEHSRSAGVPARPL
jgi:acetyltransferase-like isoleucine patch superfamily enzyme